MEQRELTIEVSSTIGKVSAAYILPENSPCIFTLAHGGGAGMNHSFMIALANALAEYGIATLRFNFPFIQNNKRMADLPVVAHKTIEAAINHAIQSFPHLPLFVTGKSFGGRMSSQYLAQHYNTNEVKGIIFYGFPLHPPKKPATDRADHLKDVKVPMLFLQGTRDELAMLDLLEPVCGSLPLSTLIKIEGADHAFKAGKKDVVTMLANYSRDWVKELLLKQHA